MQRVTGNSHKWEIASVRCHVGLDPIHTPREHRRVAEKHASPCSTKRRQPRKHRGRHRRLLCWHFCAHHLGARSAVASPSRDHNIPLPSCTPQEHRGQRACEGLVRHGGGGGREPQPQHQLTVRNWRVGGQKSAVTGETLSGMLRCLSNANDDQRRQAGRERWGWDRAAARDGGDGGVLAEREGGARGEVC